MNTLSRLFKENLITVGMITLIILILLGTTFTWMNKRKIIETTHLKAQAEEVKERLDRIFLITLRQIDMALRGYALTKNQQILEPMLSAVRENEVNLNKLDSLFKVQKLDTSLVKFGQIRKSIEGYVAFSNLMKEEADRDSLKAFVRMLNEDRGKDVWDLFAPFLASHLVYEDAQISKAEAEYEAALNRNIIIQVILVLLGVPALIFVIYITRKEMNDRRKLLVELEENNRRFLFDPGTELAVQNPREVIENSISNFKKASEFVKGITSNNYEVKWEGLDSTNGVKNSQNLAGDLLKMRDQMIVARQEDERRFWMNEGLTTFSQVVRNHQADLAKLSDEVTRFLVQYMKAQQGILFVLNDETEDDKFLALAACYAYDKKKFIDKRFEIGDGMIGQAYLEGQSIVLKQVPPDYVHITSGLGHATPRSLCIIPLKFNEKTEAMLELASFHFFEPHHMEFLEKAGEFVASAIVSAKVSTRMKVLLEQSQQQSEVMHAQEEEMRQNMEELQATQEEMARKGRELEDKLNQSNQKEQDLKGRLMEMEGLKREEKGKH